MRKLLPALILCVFFLTACGSLQMSGEIKAEPVQAPQQSSIVSVKPEENVEQGPDEAEPAQTPDPKATIDLSKMPNEAGKIMVLMYHNIGSVEKEWVRTPENFIKDLTTLYEKGYRPISLTDYVTGHIAVEQGYSPVVITFDDGNMNNFEYLEDGTIRKDCAVGLLMDFHGKHPDFPLEATFFLDGRIPFRQKALISQKLDFLTEQGMDIGNHTKTHENLKDLTANGIQEQIGAQAQFLSESIHREDYVINTLALPFGGRPKDESLKKYLGTGLYDGLAYENIAILNVGWKPGYSPYDLRFDRESIPRVRASEMKVDQVGLYNYIAYFDKNPRERFISDGVAEIITIPEDQKGQIKPLAEKEIYTYSPIQKP